MALSVSLSGLSDFSAKMNFADMNSYGWIVDGDGLMIVHPSEKALIEVSLKTADQQGFTSLEAVADDILNKLESMVKSITNRDNEKVVMVWHAL